MSINLSSNINKVSDLLKVAIDFYPEKIVLVFSKGLTGTSQIIFSLMSKQNHNLAFGSHGGQRYGSRWNEKIKLTRSAFATHAFDFGKEYSNNLKVITLIRDPMSQMFSQFMYFNKGKNFSVKKGRGKLLVNLVESENYEILNKMFSKFTEQQKSVDFFDSIFIPCTGFNIYDHNINLSNGYAVLNSGAFELIIGRTERINETFPKMLSKRFGVGLLPLSERKILEAGSSHLDFYKKYRGNICIKKEVFHEIYDTKWVKHFFSQSEINKSYEIWKTNLID
ncbi:hypothetical protein N9F34_05065 [Alphaproteobacteria bacterium]|nr:hypothetical protein [Alphaproteobacteria bacterium]